MSKFKVGDKVRVVDVISSINVELYSEQLKDVYVAKCGVVADVWKNHPYPYTVMIPNDLGYFPITCWQEDELELVE